MITAEELAAILEAVGAHIASEIDRKLTDPLTRLATLEARPLARDGRDGAPGVPGPAGERGRDGVDGKAGVDGRDFGDLAVIHDGERTITLLGGAGDQVREVGRIYLAGLPLYRGVWTDGREYHSGDRVTWGGSEWHCTMPTQSKPGDGSKAWTLAVKRGRDGRDAAR